MHSKIADNGIFDQKNSWTWYKGIGQNEDQNEPNDLFLKIFVFEKIHQVGTKNRKSFITNVQSVCL